MKKNKVKVSYWVDEKHKKAVNKEAKRLKKSLGRKVSESEVIRYLIESSIK